MPIVKIRPKGQITIPAEILTAWHVQSHERINVNLVNGVVILTPMKKNKTSIMSYAGIAQGLWGESADDSDNFIRNEREPPKNPTREKDDIMSYAGIFSGTWGETSAEVETTLRNLHNEWEK